MPRKSIRIWNYDAVKSCTDCGHSMTHTYYSYVCIYENVESIREFDTKKCALIGCAGSKSAIRDKRRYENWALVMAVNFFFFLFNFYFCSFG